MPMTSGRAPAIERSWRGLAKAIPTWLGQLRAGLITGAADDDPSGIATYSQAGARYGYGTLWTVILTLPLMIGIQMICATVGRVTGRGLAANMRLYFPRWLVLALVFSLLIANIINLAADIGAMGAAWHLLMGGSAPLYAALFATISLLLEVFVPFPRYSPFLKLLTLALFSYVAVAFMADVPWASLGRLLWPRGVPLHDYFVMIVAIFGTTISPYLFFWQASEEVEEADDSTAMAPLSLAPAEAVADLKRIRFDTVVGMTYSNLVAFFIMVTAAAVLRPNGIIDIQTSSQAAQALAPLAGKAASLLFAVGIIGTGLLAVPVLAGSAAYAVTEAAGQSARLSQKPGDARIFYLIIAGATVLGTLLSFSSMDPIRMLFWAAVINGVMSVPLMVGIMWIATQRKAMDRLVIGGRLRWLGWLATAAMAFVVLGMFL